MSADSPSTHPSLLSALYNPSNNEAAWRTFLERYQPLIDCWCRRAGLQDADAEEVSAEVQAKLARAMRRFRYDPAARFRAWLKTVVQNALNDFWSERKRTPGAQGGGGDTAKQQLEEHQAPSDVDSLVEELDEQLAQDLRLAEQVSARVQQRVKAHTWEAYWLTAIEGQPATEVAERLEMTTLAVYVAKNRVGKMLRQEGAKVRAQAPPAEGERLVNRCPGPDKLHSCRR
jgi:RNA polymerase sigma-70 factor (ECF subfamily)